ncbi:MAG: carboxypeptidase-like regulatory domain-containing protein, partial [Candidatus Gastranaerophilales bacterium]|nr:carboxypeptidase-like regulatory domain-containing protein [Candidatus Gastranaerophilales bacterium]
TNTPIEGVIVKIPAKNYETKTKKDGSFKLQTNINSPAIMSVEKSGYKPQSMTIGSALKNPISIGIEKTTPKDIIVETDMIHIGDDSFSSRSANAGEFSLNSKGSFYTKDFNIKPMKPDENLYLIIGSIIGIDTIEAQRMGQSNVLTAYSSPPELYFNGNKISEIKINGDNQKISIPKGLIKQNQKNNVTIKTGRNLYKTSDIDYDDIEFTNILFEIK